uniref:Putative 5.3 kDa protein n=1 Tax=Ixodes ricinus TaxID=34613 RepID=A0A0K8R7N2_IXORI
MRALIICALLLLHGMLSMAEKGFSPGVITPYIPKCGQTCTRSSQCPTDCKHCLKYRNRNEPACSKRNRV